MSSAVTSETLPLEIGGVKDENVPDESIYQSIKIEGHNGVKK